MCRIGSRNQEEVGRCSATAAVLRSARRPTGSGAKRTPAARSELRHAAGGGGGQGAGGWGLGVYACIACSLLPRHNQLCTPPIPSKHQRATQPILQITAFNASYVPGHFTRRDRGASAIRAVRGAEPRLDQRMFCGHHMASEKT
jgi:hypothetical protein